jgi:hypothetical protein
VSQNKGQQVAALHSTITKPATPFRCPSTDINNSNPCIPKIDNAKTNPIRQSYRSFTPEHRVRLFRESPEGPHPASRHTVVVLHQHTENIGGHIVVLAMLMALVLIKSRLLIPFFSDMLPSRF